MSQADNTLWGHPKGLYVLFFTEMWERFSFYGMRALLILYMLNHFMWTQERASALFGTYSSLAYGTPILGGLIADKLLGAKKTVIVGGVLLSIGHFLMAFEGMMIFYTALGFIIAGVGCLKPNVSTQVGSLYAPKDHRRDGGFTIFYMGINLGAFLGPLVCDYLHVNYGFHYGFGAAGVGMVLGLTVYILGHRKLVELAQVAQEDHPEGNDAVAVSQGDTSEEPVPSALVTRDRIIVLLIIFVFVILFWMAFEQSANVMVIWADKHTNLQPFSTHPPPVHLTPETTTQAQQGWRSWSIGAGATQSINPFFIISLAPVFAWFWMWLDRRHLQPSTPTKMALGIALMGGAFLVLLPATRRENQPCSVPLASAPAGVDFSKYGATRLHYDAQAHVLRMHGVIPDTDRLQMLATAVSPEFKNELQQIVDQAAERAAKAGFSEKWELHATLQHAPPGFAIQGEEAPKVVTWAPQGRVLTITGKINERARVELLASGAPLTFKQAIDELFVTSARARVTIWWLALHFLLLTMGELCLSPVGLSLVTKMAPAQYVGLFMGGWFLATAVAEKAAHMFGERWGTMPPTTYFTIFIVICAVGALLLALLIRPLKRMMHGIQ